MRDDRSNAPAPPRELSEWIDSHDECERIELTTTWALSGLAAGSIPDDEEVEYELAAFQRRMEAEQSVTVPREPAAADRLPARRLRVLRLAVAAGIVLLVASIVLLTSNRFETVSNPPGAAPVSHLFPDGSRAVIAPGSTLRFSSDMNGPMRLVRLTGEAFFDVESNDIPFVVETDLAKVRVVGTRFNVRSWPDVPEEGTAATVEEGIVTISALGHASRGRRLNAGEASRVLPGSDRPTEPYTVPLDRVASWRNGAFFFNDRALSVIVRDVARRFDVRVEIPKNSSTERLVLYIDRPGSAEEVLGVVAAASGLTLERTSEGFVLK